MLAVIASGTSAPAAPAAVERADDSGSRRRLRVAAGLGLIVLVSSVGWTLAALLGKTPWIFADELFYSELAKSIGSGHLPAIREVTDFQLGFGYPLLVAPAWGLFADVESAYTAARIVNGIVMSLAAVPAYLLARRFASEGRALVVALFSVLVPSMVYVGTLMTEVALYPAFLVVLVATARALERPTVRNQLLVFGAVAVAFAVKSVAVVFVPAYAGAIVLLALLRRPLGVPLATTLRAYRLSGAVLVGAPLAFLVAGLVLTGDPVGGLGYHAGRARSIDVLGTLQWFFANLVALDLYVAVIPFAATLAVLRRCCSRTASERDRLYAALTIPMVVCVLAVVALFGSKPTADAGLSLSTQLRERNFFFVAPLLLIGLAIWTERRPRRDAVVWGAAAVAVLGVALYPWSQVPTATSPQNLAPVPWVDALSGNAARIAASTIFATLAVVLLLLTRPEHAGRLWIVVGGVFLVVGAVAVADFTDASKLTLRWGVGGDRDWIDQALGRDANVAVLWQEFGTGPPAPSDRHRIVWVDEIFNRSVGRVYALGPSMPYDLPDTPVEVEGGVVRDDAGNPIRERYVLARCKSGVDAPIVALDKGVGVAVYRTDGTVRVTGTPDPRCA
jgi:Dolichyl-phosphate-mannose-protein mannosyltransferase